MSWLNAPIVGDFMKGLFGVVDDIHTSEEEKAEIKLKFMQIGMSADLGQLAINKQEAAHGKVFVSGWRPFVGWTCGCALAYTYIVDPLIRSTAFYLASFNGVELDLSGLPTIDLAVLMPVLLGMLGLGGLRTFEKVQGVARANLEETQTEPAQSVDEVSIPRRWFNGLKNDK